ncbi:MAG: hypothetical protein QM529_02510 [Hydrotalea sp.]|nr:hypothetical protein [Hydrotalea sp.]
MIKKKLSKKQIIEILFTDCKKKGDFVFHNDDVKKISQGTFSNQFDVTKIDSSTKLPPILREMNYGLIHLGGGYHQFVYGINNLYHTFELTNDQIQWPYQKSLLNNYNTSESNLLSVANNQRILHHFVFGENCDVNHPDIKKRPKTYFPHRTKYQMSYLINNQLVETKKSLQMEIDLTIEYQGVVAVFEAKNGTPIDFSIYQLFNPCYYYHQARKDEKVNGSLKEIYAVYLTRKDKLSNILNLWCYRFKNPEDMGSIEFIKSASYHLIHE